MNTEKIKFLGTLEVLLESLPYIGLPGHITGEYIYPFIWEASKQEDFNALNLSISRGWLKLTDNDVIRTSSQGIEYTKSFSSYSLNRNEEKLRLDKIIILLRLLNNNLQVLETFDIQAHYYARGSISIVIGKTIDGDWISVCPTVYTETTIPQEQIFRTQQSRELNLEEMGENTKNLVSEIEAIISELGTINFSGDLGGGYYYSYEHRIVYSVSKTRESAIEKTLQGSGILELSKFHGFYSDKLYFEKDHFSYQLEQRDSIYQIYNRINNFSTKLFLRL